MTSRYGLGDYGVGDYGTATLIAFKGSGSWRNDGRGRVVPSPRFRGLAAPFSFAGSTRFVGARLAAVGFTAAANAGGTAAWDLEAVWSGPPASSRFDGGGFFTLALRDDETIRPKAAPWGMAGSVAFRQDMRATGWSGAATWGGEDRAQVLVRLEVQPASATFGGSVRPLLIQQVQLSPAGSRFDGAAGRFRITSKLLRNRASWSMRGAVVFKPRPVFRARGASRFAGRMGARMLFKAGFRPSAARFDGYGVLSYSWSDLTAPGRYPLPPWGGVPEASGGWGAVPPPGDEWGAVPPPSEVWSDAPAGGGAWSEVE